MAVSMEDSGVASQPIAWYSDYRRAPIEAIYVPGDGLSLGSVVFWTPLSPGGSELPEAIYHLAGIADYHTQTHLSLEELGFFSRQIRLVLPLPLTKTGRPPRHPYGAVKVHGMATGILQALEILAQYPLTQESRQYGPLFGGKSLTFWAAATKFAQELVSSQRYIPTIKKIKRNHACVPLWIADLGRNIDQERFRLLSRSCPPVAHALAVTDNLSVWKPAHLLQQFLDNCVDNLVRAAQHQSSSAYSGIEIAKSYETESWESQWIKGLTTQDRSIVDFGSIKNVNLPVELGVWQRLAHEYDPDALRLCLRLDYPDEQGQWRLHYLLQSPDDPSLILPVDYVWQAVKQIKLWSRTFENPQAVALAALGAAGRIFTPIQKSLEAAAPSGVDLNLAEADSFVANAIEALEDAGVSILLPAEFMEQRNTLGVRLVSDDTKDIKGSGHFGESLFNSYCWRVSMGDEHISEHEFRQMAAFKGTLVKWRGHWVRVNPDQVSSIETFLKRRNKQQLSSAEVLGAALGGDSLANELGIEVAVKLEGNLKGLVTILEAGGFQPQPAPDHFQGKLRPYQERGLGWLTGLSEANLGGCLADDMGLGKTVQIIAWLLQKNRSQPTLIVCPTSLIGNWRRELRKFAPSLKPYLHYGPGRPRSEATLCRNLDGDTVVITSYQTMQLDQELLTSMEWDCAIVDEAQNIKNPHTKQARAIHKLKAKSRVALSGTPVENRLSELWSILEFTTPGLLGSYEQFQEKLALPIERFRDRLATQRLQALTRPFVLRRLKTDASIINDLPAKEEFLAECALTREQASLYQAKVDETLAALAALSGFQRASKILSSLTALKQICNHPAHFLKEPGPLAKRSGKIIRLELLLEKFLNNGEAVLIFTQYAVMGQLLADHITARFNEKVLFFKGITSQKKREEMVERFQKPDGPRIFILSLKAGGTGLTLTRASQVIHYDRWWNPAVEDQATDRAFRIGQKQRVQVHKFVCPGTLEEKIDFVLNQKRDLAKQALGTAGDKWITDLSDDELKDLLLLGEDALVSEEGDEE